MHIKHAHYVTHDAAAKARSPLFQDSFALTVPNKNAWLWWQNEPWRFRRHSAAPEGQAFRQHGHSLTTMTVTLAEGFTAHVSQTRHELNMPEMKAKGGLEAPVCDTYAAIRKGRNGKWSHIHVGCLQGRMSLFLLNKEEEMKEKQSCSCLLIMALTREDGRGFKIQRPQNIKFVLKQCCGLLWKNGSRVEDKGKKLIIFSNSSPSCYLQVFIKKTVSVEENSAIVWEYDAAHATCRSYLCFSL